MSQQPTPLCYNRVELRYEIRDKQSMPVDLSSPERVAAFCRPMAFSLQECLLVIAVNTRKQLVGLWEAARGGIDRCQVHPPDIFRAALVLAPTATGLLVVHNHPSSGDPEPSDEDREFFGRIRGLGDQLELPVIDFLISGSQSTWSDAAGGIVQPPPSYTADMEPAYERLLAWRGKVSGLASA